MAFPYWPGSAQIFQQLAIDGEELSIVPFGNTVMLPTTYSSLTADHISTTVLDANDINVSTIFAYEVFIDNQGLTATPTELLLNGVPIAVTSNLSSIAEWSYDPALQDVFMDNFSLVSTNIVDAKTVSSSQGLFSSINSGTLYANSIVCEDLTALSSIHSYNYTSSSHLIADDAVISSINTNSLQSSTIQTQALTTNSLQSSTIQTQALTTSTLNGLPVPTQYVLPENLTVSSLIINNVVPGAISLYNKAGNMSNDGIFYSGGTYNGFSIGGSNYFGNPTTIGDPDLYNANLIVQGGATLDGGTLHGTTIGCLPVLGVNTVRLDVLPAGIDITSPTYVTMNVAGAGNWAIGGALSLSAGDYVEINTGETQFINTTSGESLVSMNHLQGNSHNGGSGRLYIDNLSSINGFPISHYEPGGVSTVSTFVDLLVTNNTSSLTVNTDYINGYSGPVISIGPPSGANIYFDTTPTASVLQIDSFPSGNSFMNADNISIDTLQPKNGSEITVLGTTTLVASNTQVYASNVRLGASTLIEGDGNFPALVVRNNATSGMAQVNASAFVVGDPVNTFEGAYSYSIASDRATVLNSTLQTKYVAYLDDLQNLVNNSVSTNTVEAGQGTFTNINADQILIPTAGLIQWSGGASVYEATGSRLFMTNGGAGSIDIDGTGGGLNFTEPIGGGSMIFINNELQVNKVLAPNISSTTEDVSQLNVSSIAIQGLANSTITLGTSATAGTQGQPAGRLVVTGQDVDLGGSDLWANQVRVGAGQSSAPGTAEVTFYDVTGNRVKGLLTGSGDTTIRISDSSQPGVNAPGYILDTRINPPFFSTINNQVNMMAYFPSTSASTIGVSTISLIPNYFVSAFASTSQTVLGANTPTPLDHNATVVNVGGFTVLGSTITVPVAGVYEIGTSIQLDKNGGGVNFADFWFRKNGVDIPNSASQTTVQGNTGQVLATVTIFDTANANDKYSILLASDDATMRSAYFQSTVTTPFTKPAIPAIITNIKRIG